VKVDGFLPVILKYPVNTSGPFRYQLSLDAERNFIARFVNNYDSVVRQAGLPTLLQITSMLSSGLVDILVPSEEPKPLMKMHLSLL